MIAIESRAAQANVWPQTKRIASVDIIDNLAAAETIWRGFEGPNHSVTPYQRFDFLAPWQREVGERGGLSPFIVIARDVAGRPRGLLPLALQTTLGVRCATFMGGTHANFNMGLWEREFAAAATEADLKALLAMLAVSDEVDVLALRQQPLHWRDLQNPLWLLPHEPLAFDCPLRTIRSSATAANLISNSLRRRLRNKERKLQPLAGYRYHIASADADITRLLDWFFRVKSQRLAKQKLPNVFAEPGVSEFIRAACMTKLPYGGRVIEIHALECDEEVIAIWAVVADGNRFSTMFNTYTLSGNARFSPGLLLMRHIIDRFIGQHGCSFDFGIGSDDYKREFCKDDEPTFDSNIPLTVLGRLAAGAMSGVSGAKRLVKRNPALLGVAQNLRSMFRQAA
ncbi:GNAT family N-acetyltransferase [Bradyrhizobium jicamae]|uniref:GNAT family N-acetyltransferase n=1 Tax=Bradyrhizobium jicamae TaxID=280332 RepID=A0ABS5FY08_9BRAD|nr:GNAT family N-acetyltransferase [Bradyrhizobium jicamae]MBR0801136.1 GNAT family N-acetyltransferase [Bradyrhizobium jicamae]